MTNLRLLCLNLHGGRGMDGSRDLSRVHDLLEQENIDIGIFQEMETRASFGGKADDVTLLAGPSRPHHLSGAGMMEGDAWYGNLIASRYPIIRGLVHNLDTPATAEPRTAIDVLIETPCGRFRVIGTHLSLLSPHRSLEMHNLLKLIAQVEETEKNPILLMGDINEWRWSSALLRHLNRTMSAVPCGRTFPSFFPAFKLDRLWHDGLKHRISARAINRPSTRVLSDHLPILIEISRAPDS